jgi:2-keto-4-pentenoate hydratase/2-oxohepta-3-ene-1,7-dioic acid hydratase in catechol pathway
MTRISNVSGRAKIVLTDGLVDIAKASDGRFSPEIQDLYERWNEFTAWVATAHLHADETAASDDQIGSPAPTPRQVIGVGINYRSSLDNGGFEQPSSPGVFSKFATSIGGPYEAIQLTSDRVITEVELAVVIGRRADSVSEQDALDYVAGVTVAQDLIDGPSVIALIKPDGSRGPSYMDLGKSRPGFAPIGPDLVTLDEAGDLTNLDVDLFVDGVQWQQGNTSELLFSVPQIISRVSHQIPLLPGDVILTGSPYWLAVGAGQPLAAGSEVVATVGRLGTQRKRVLAQVDQRSTVSVA